MAKNKMTKYWVSNSLIDSFGYQYFEYLIPLLEQFSQELIPLWGYELKIQHKEFEVDIQLCINSGNRRPELLVQLANTNQFAEDRIWPGVSEFAKKWSDESHHFQQKVPNIWFEFDQVKIQSGIFTPNMFFAPLKGSSSKEICELTNEVYSIIQKEEIDQSPRLSLEKCLSLLNNGAWVSQIGIMFARKSNNLRLFIQDLSPGGTVSFLDSMNWTGNKKLLVSSLDTFSKLVDFIDLDIDIFHSISDKIGLELYIKNSNKSIPKIKRALNKLYEMDLIYPIHYKNLINYFNEIEDQKNNSIEEFLHHIKLGLSTSEKLEVKVYVGLRQNRKMRLLSSIFSNSSIKKGQQNMISS